MYPKKPLIKKTREALTPDQLCNKQQIKTDQEKAACARRKEKRAAFEKLSTPDELCNTQQIKKEKQKEASV